MIIFKIKVVIGGSNVDYVLQVNEDLKVSKLENIETNSFLWSRI